MRIEVVARGGPHEIEVDDARVVGWGNGPGADRELADVAGATRAALEDPLDYPPLALAIVPDDHVAVAIDPAMPGAGAVLDALVAAIRAAGAGPITVVATRPGPPLGPADGVTWVAHDPDDRNALAYLASTKEGHRVYLARALTDADLVIPVGPIEDDPALGYRGPWSTLFPELSDRDTLNRFRAAAAAAPAPDGPTAGFAESAEVSWLLGSQFQVGVVSGGGGPLAVIAGIDSSVRDRGPAASERAWARRFPEPADLVVAGVGSPGQPSTLDDLARGLANAARAVRRGGKVVVFAEVDDEPGPALRRLAAAEGARGAVARLRDLDAEPDGDVARRVADAAAWADVYLRSNLDPDLVDDLGMVPLDRPEEATRLAGRASSLIAIGRAERGRVVIADPDDDQTTPTP